MGIVRPMVEPASQPAIGVAVISFPRIFERGEDRHHADESLRCASALRPSGQSVPRSSALGICQHRCERVFQPSESRGVGAGVMDEVR
jgi:hypothetical protein